MGGNSQETQTTQTSSKSPYAPAVAGINGVLGNLGMLDPNLTSTESGALGQLTALGQAGDPYAGAIGGAANAMLTGGKNYTPVAQDAYNTSVANLTPMATGAYNDPTKNPAWQSYLNSTTADVNNNLGSMYAAAGRDPSGAGNYGQNVARGVAQATAPTALSLIQNAQANQLAANNYNGSQGGTTAGVLGSLQAQQYGNMANGATMANNAMSASTWGPTQMLQAAAQARGIPLEALTGATGILGTLGQLGGTSTGNSTSTTSTPFNPLSLAPLALGVGLAPFTGGASLGMAGMGAANMFGGGQTYSGADNMAAGGWRPANPFNSAYALR